LQKKHLEWRMTQFRKPTVDEAAQSILNAMTKEFRVLSIQFFRKEYGDDFADSVKLVVEKKWKKK